MEPEVVASILKGLFVGIAAGTTAIAAVAVIIAGVVWMMGRLKGEACGSRFELGPDTFYCTKRGRRHQWHEHRSPWRYAMWKDEEAVNPRRENGR